MLVSIDTEASGPCPTLGDVISIGAVVVEPGLNRTLLVPNMRPMFDQYNETAYKSIGMNRQQHLEALITLDQGFRMFAVWIHQNKKHVNERVVLVSDNPAFDWQWINWGFHTFCGSNPCGHSARRIGDMWSGLKGNIRDHSKWKKLRITKHTHNPLDDALGNAEAIIKMWECI